MAGRFVYSLFALPAVSWLPMQLTGTQLVAFPTETVWGLGARPTPEGLGALVVAKGAGREQKPVQISCLNIERALELCKQPERVAAFAPLLPGPLSLIARAREDVPPHIAPNGWVGLRVPAHPVARQLLAAHSGRLLTTSLNRSGEPPARTEAEARALALANIVLADHEDGTRKPSGLASTIVRLEDDGWHIVREGHIDAATLTKLAGAPPLSSAALLTRVQRPL